MASERDDDGPERKESVKYWEIIADNLKKTRAGVWTTSQPRADEMLTAFVELESAIHEFAVSLIS
jgi:hypothetical protein